MKSSRELCEMSSYLVNILLLFSKMTYAWTYWNITYYMLITLLPYLVKFYFQLATETE